jgi:hypothetical protein
LEYSNWILLPFLLTFLFKYFWYFSS